MGAVGKHKEADPLQAARAAGVMRRRRFPFGVLLLVGALIAGGLAVLALTGGNHDDEGTPPVVRHSVYRAFTANSFWNTALPATAPLDPHGSKILHYLRTAPESGKGCLSLAGAGSNPWGNPIYWAKPADPTYDVTGVEYDRPQEVTHLRIPVSAEPAANSDETMSIYDMQKGYVVALSGAVYHPATDTWTARGATVTYLRSNGLNVKIGQSDDPRNVGTHRGNNGATMTVSWDQVERNDLRHVLKVAGGPELSSRHVFPMTGSDGGYRGKNPAVPPEGLRLRIKPTVDLSSLALGPQALVIARALQQYGFYFGDSGGTTALKLENTRAEGRGQLWTLPADALCSLPFTPKYWDVVAEGYNPGR
ncbi:MAG: hypothetical protein ACRDPG_10650 [Nocardioidaceae bacterium]